MRINFTQKRTMFAIAVVVTCMVLTPASIFASMHNEVAENETKPLKEVSDDRYEPVYNESCKVANYYTDQNCPDSMTVDDNTEENKYIETQEEIIEVPIYNTREEAEKAELKESANENTTDSQNAKGVGAANMTYRVYRSGNTSSCEIYGKWSCSDYVNEFSFKKLVIKNTSTTTKYCTIKPKSGHTYRWYTFNSSKSGQKRMQNFTCPTSQKKVKIVVTSQMIHRTEYGWLALGNFETTQKFN